MSKEHSTLLTVHKARYVSASDPGAVGAGKEWLDISQTPPVAYYRNGGDSAWVEIVAATGLNVGGGAEIYKSRAGGEHSFRTLESGANITLLQTGTNVRVDVPFVGEVNTAANLGTDDDGEAIFDNKSGVEFQFRRVKAGAAISVQLSGDSVIVDTLGFPTATRYATANEAQTPDALDQPFRSVGSLPGPYTALGTDTLTDSRISGDILVVDARTGGQNSNLTLPVTGDFTFTVLLATDEINVNYGTLGLMIRGNTFQYRFGYQWADGVNIQLAQWADNDTFGSNVGARNVQYASERYFRVVVAGTTAAFQISQTGFNWVDIIDLDFASDVPEGIQAAGVGWNAPVAGIFKWARFNWDPDDSVATPRLVSV